uniref:Uncharacterized protein n=1 Tax=Eptatretus burgeri TaxID=7764 RepID=A0A8C4RA55_EPTBU
MKPKATWKGHTLSARWPRLQTRPTPPSRHRIRLLQKPVCLESKTQRVPRAARISPSIASLPRPEDDPPPLPPRRRLDPVPPESSPSKMMSRPPESPPAIPPRQPTIPHRPSFQERFPDGFSHGSPLPPPPPPRSHTLPPVPHRPLETFANDEPPEQSLSLSPAPFALCPVPLGRFTRYTDPVLPSTPTFPLKNYSQNPTYHDFECVSSMQGPPLPPRPSCGSQTLPKLPPKTYKRELPTPRSRVSSQEGSELQ